MIKKTNKKGFTLVEIIVVLVILAIMAVIVLPSFTGWIKRAEAKRCIVERSMLARDYQVNAAYNVYEVADDTKANALLADSANQLFKLTSTNNTLVGTCGNLWTVTYSNDRNFISEIFCAKHGSIYAYDDEGLVYHGASPDVLINKAIKLSGVTLTDNTDSTAPNGINTVPILNYMKANGIDLDALHVKSWAIRKESGYSQKIMFWSDQDISALNVGDSVRIIRYNPNNNTYTAGYMTITTTTEGGQTYNVFSGGTGSSVWTQAAGQSATTKASYEDTIKIFNEMKEIKTA